MKQKLFFLGFAFFCLSTQAQTTELANELKSLILTKQPQWNLDDKLIAISVWSTDDKNSRESNRVYEKVCSTYAHAKLQGGRKGVIVILINKNNPDDLAQIALGKDNIHCSLTLKWSDITAVTELPEKNAVYNSAGKKIASNLATESVFSTFQSLITR